MARGISTCMTVRSDEPWVGNFDKFNEQGSSVPNGKIDRADLERWKSIVKPNVISDKDNTTPLCPFFRADMIRRKFINQIVRPELERKTALSPAERQKRASDVTLEAGSMFMEITQLSKDNIELGVIILRNTIDVLLSLHYEKPSLYGLGIAFEKEVGKPALVTGNMGDSTITVDEPLLPGQTLITEIDGNNLLPLSQGEVRSLMRGPKDSPVTLTTIFPGTSKVKNYTLTRQWLSPSLVE